MLVVFTGNVAFYLFMVRVSRFSYSQIKMSIHKAEILSNIISNMELFKERILKYLSRGLNILHDREKVLSLAGFLGLVFSRV